MSTAAAPLAYLTRRYRFAASHRLHVAALSDEENSELFGKCNNPFGHGHNYFVQVTLAGPVDPETGMVVNLRDLDGFAATALFPRFDLANLNQDPAFAENVPSTENLCIELWRVFTSLAQRYGHVRLHRIRVEETHNNAFEYFGEAEEQQGRHDASV